MIIMVYSETTGASIAKNLGLAEYSYYFVLKAFWPVLERFGLVVSVADPAHDVDAIRRSAARFGEETIFLSFTPPHHTQINLDCPTIPVLAWEFADIPSETWDDNPLNDWRIAFRATGRAITHSQFAANAIRKSMGADYPVVSIPAPVWDRFAARRKLNSPPIKPRTTLHFSGVVFDTAEIDLSVYARENQPFKVPPPHQHDYIPRPTSLTLEGVIYSAVFNPSDGRKNPNDLLAGFCWAMRDIPDATLVIKLTHREPMSMVAHFLQVMQQCTPFQCRVVLIHGFMDDPTYEAFADLSTYTVNTSHGEGQCLPLMEFMSYGKPAVSPNHTAMAEYVTEDTGFIVSSSRDPHGWPQDPRHAFRTYYYRISFESLVDAYRESYRVAKEEPARYAQLSVNATEALRKFCSADVATERLSKFLGLQVLDVGERSAKPALVKGA